jgi:hypothetical protein
VPDSYAIVRAKRGKPQGAAAAQDLRLFERGMRNQARIYVWMQERWVKEIQQIESVVPEIDRDRAVQDHIDKIRDDLVAMGQFWARCAPAMVAAKKARKELLKLLPTEQLEAQLAAELAKAAKAFSDEEWQAMVRAREMVAAVEDVQEEKP